MPKANLGPRLTPPDAKTGLYSIRWWDAEKQRTIRVSARTANLPEAQRVLAGFLLEKEQDQERGVRWTVGQVIDYYDINHIETKVADKKRQRKALSYLKDILGEDVFMDEMDAESFTAYRKARKKPRKKFVKSAKKEKAIPGANDATIRRELNTFLAAANYAVRNRKIENRHVPVVGLPEHNAGRDRWLVMDEAKHLMATAQPAELNRLSRVYRLIALALGTYRRRRAMETLKWFQVDLKNRTIDFRRPGEPETKKRRGIAAIADWLLPILERAYSEKVSEYVLDSPGTLNRTISKVAKAAGMPDVTAHTLRHTGGTWAAQSGASMWEIAGAMGCTVATAERNYLHHSPEHLRRVVNRVSPDIMGTADLPADEKSGR